MCRGVLSFLLFLLCSRGEAFAGQAEVDKAGLLKQAQALQELVQATIRTAEPAIASVVVSRSDAYQRYGQGPSAANPGNLGPFDPEALERFLDKYSLPQKERERVRRRLDLGDPAHVPESYGGGVIIDDRGRVLTYYHVVRGASKIFVRWPGSSGSYADIHAADPRSDLAILRLQKPISGLKTLPLGDGSQAERGQFVVALANPYPAGSRDGRPSASLGIVSNIRQRPPAGARNDEAAGVFHDHGPWLQTDIRLPLSFSGAAVLNLRGELIGLTNILAAAQSSDAPGALALPLGPKLNRIIAVLNRGEEVEYGFLGVSFDREGSSKGGVVLNRVTPGSPAHRHGLHARDAILAVNGEAVRTGDELFHRLHLLLAGSAVILDVRKAGAQESVRLEILLAKSYVPGKKIASSLGSRPFFRGLRVDYTSLLVQTEAGGLALGRIPAGVLVSDVRADTSAATALLRAGDVITHVNGRAVETPAAFYQEVAGKVGPVELTLAGGRPGQPAPKVVLN
jgi:S1-C subfamily serine protease